MRQTFFITGTDTGVGKTVLTALLAGHLRGCGASFTALKPVCSGDRDDARLLRTALAGTLTLDEINPWHFRAPLAPLLAARRENKRIRLADVLGHLRAQQRRFDVVLVEGAGGLLSPLGENFDSLDLLTALRATPILVVPNRIGSVNQARLTLRALPHSAFQRARVVLVSQPGPDVSAGTNAGLLAEYFDAKRIFGLPWLGRRFDPEKVLVDSRVRRTLRALVK